MFSQNKLIILVRHAEKADDSQDTELSAEGKARAERLVKAIGKYRPGAFYSTNYKRTRDTMGPLAAKSKKQIQTYDPRQTQGLMDEIMKSETSALSLRAIQTPFGPCKSFRKKELFKNLDESEYGVIWFIRIKNGKVAKVEILDY